MTTSWIRVPGGQGDHGDLVTVLDVVGESAACTIEGIGRVATDSRAGEDEAALDPPIPCVRAPVHYESNAASILQPHCAATLC